MATSRGGTEVRRFMAVLPGELTQKVLRGAARAAATVVVDEAKNRVASDEVREAITMRATAKNGQISVRITVKRGFARSIAYWLEYGTDPHFISVDDDLRRGMSVRRINSHGTDDHKATLVINGRPVGKTVFHPGASRNPFLRVSLDLKEAEAVAAAQNYINARVRPSGIAGAAEPEGDDL